jgi:hypothetical protein
MYSSVATKMKTLKFFLFTIIIILISTYLINGQNLAEPQIHRLLLEIYDKMEKAFSKLDVANCDPKALKLAENCEKLEPGMTTEQLCCKSENSMKCLLKVVREAKCDQKDVQEYTTSLNFILYEFKAKNCQNNKLCIKEEPTTNNPNSSASTVKCWFKNYFILVPYYFLALIKSI